MQKWHIERMETLKDNGQYYATKFSSAAAVAGYVASHFAALHAQTRLWHETWYDSTLPYWFLDRTMLNTSSLASSTSHRFATGRFCCRFRVSKCLDQKLRKTLFCICGSNSHLDLPLASALSIIRVNITFKFQNALLNFFDFRR